MNNIATKTLLVILLISPTLVGQTLVDFESDLSPGSLDPDSFFNGGPSDNTDPWTAAGIEFNNTFTDFGSFTAWAGWSYSNIVDSTTVGFGNQYAAFPESGADSSSTYAVAFEDTFNGVSPTVNFGQAVEDVQISLTNTTYAYRAIFDGDDGAGFVRQFGDNDGLPGNDGEPDFFLLEITGLDESGSETGTVDFYLADYRFADNGDDYVVDTWTDVDLSSLGQIESLRFNMVTTDVTGGFANTPFYFAADNLSFVAVPEPSAVTTLGLLALVNFRRRRRSMDS